MNKSNILKRVLKILGTIIIFLCIAFTNGKNRKVTGIEEVFASIITSPQRLFTYLSNKIENNDSFKNIDELKEQNKSLLSENEELKKQLSDYSLLKESYKTLVYNSGLENTYSNYEIVLADVISDSANNWDKLYIINKGSSSGIVPGQVVITKDGLVGYVSTCTANTSKIISILDVGNTVSGRNVVTREVATLKGSLSTKDEQKLVITNIPYGVTFNLDDEIETSGMGMVYPKGIPIGRVVLVDNASNPLSERVYVKTFVDFNKLENVAVIVNNQSSSGDFAL